MVTNHGMRGLNVRVFIRCSLHRHGQSGAKILLTEIIRPGTVTYGFVPTLHPRRDPLASGGILWRQSGQMRTAPVDSCTSGPAIQAASIKEDEQQGESENQKRAVARTS